VTDTKKFILGLIGSPFGVKGFVKIRSLSGEIDHLLKLKSVIISKDGKERTLQIEESSPSGDTTVLMRFVGIDSPEAAKTLNGGQLLGGRDQAAPLSEGEFYIEDLKGLQVYGIPSRQDASNLWFAIAKNAKGNKEEEIELLGIITNIIEGGNGELVEIKLINGEKKLVPFRKEFFKDVSLEKGRAILQELWILGD